MYQVTTRAELARVGGAILDALGEGERAEDLLRSMLGVEADFRDTGVPALGRLATLLSRLVEAFTPLPVAQLEKAAAAAGGFATALGAVPDPVDLAHVGVTVVKSPAVAAGHETWSARLRQGGSRREIRARLIAVTNEVVTAMGDLERARLRARLSLMRLDADR